MKKTVLSLAIAAAMAPGFAAAADVSGFADIGYVISDDKSATGAGVTGTEGKFSANGEVDFSASPTDGVTARIDVDLALASNGGNNASGLTGGPADSAAIEQAFFAWGVTEGVTVIGGVFNNPIGAEAEDKPEMTFNSHGIVYSVLDDQTALNGDNVAGLAVAGAIGPVTLTAAFLNDLGQVNDENSMALVVNYSPIKGLDLEAGMVTQSDKGTVNAQGGNSAGDVTNFNVVYSPEQVAGLTVGLDYLDADALTDPVYDLWAGYTMDKIGVAVRQSDDGTNSDIAFNVSYKVASNLKAALEIESNDVANTDKTTLKLVAKF